MYDLEFYLYGIIPMIVGILIMWQSIQISSKRRMIVSWLITFIIFVAFALAEYMLFLISFTEAWPTYLPHILLILNLILLGIQLLIKNRKPRITSSANNREQPFVATKS
jgi:hypothetical protein